MCSLGIADSTSRVAATGWGRKPVAATRLTSSTLARFYTPVAAMRLVRNWVTKWFVLLNFLKTASKKALLVPICPKRRPTGHSLPPSRHLIRPTGHSLRPTGHSLRPTGHSLRPTGHALSPSRCLLRPSSHPLPPLRHLVGPLNHPLRPSGYSGKPSSYLSRPISQVVCPSGASVPQVALRLFRNLDFIRPARKPGRPASQPSWPTRRKQYLTTLIKSILLLPL